MRGIDGPYTVRVNPYTWCIDKAGDPYTVYQQDKCLTQVYRHGTGGAAGKS
jgi:hypothetical protein